MLKNEFDQLKSLSVDAGYSRLADLSRRFCQAGQNWSIVSVNDSGRGSLIYIDRSRMQRRGTKVLYWARLELIDDPTYDYIIARWMADCSVGTSVAVGVFGYAGGRVVATLENEAVAALTRTSAVPGSIGEQLMRAACDQPEGER